MSTASGDRVVPTKFAHCVLRTSFERKSELVAWWRTLLHAEIAYENPIACFMTYDDEHHRLAVIGVPGLGERPEHVTGVDHIAFTYAGLADLVHTYERLRDLGTTPALSIHHGPTLSLYYLDPDRNQVELQIDVFPTQEAFDAFFASDHFAKNPIGVAFDVEDFVRRFHEGEPEAVLLAPLDGPPDPSVLPRH